MWSYYTLQLYNIIRLPLAILQYILLEFRVLVIKTAIAIKKVYFLIRLKSILLKIFIFLRRYILFLALFLFLILEIIKMRFGFIYYR